MPLPGIGVAPAAGSLYNELSAVNRRAFVPKLFVQIYFASPSLFYMMGNAQKAAGGLNQITIPAQGASMVQGQFTGYGGGFNSPSIIPAIQNLQFNLAYWVVPVPLPFGETVIQASDREISLLKARMNDVRAVTVQNMATLMYTNNTGNALLPNSFVDATDSGTTYPVYGGINRTLPGNSAFQGVTINMGLAGGAFSVASITRASMANVLAYATDQAGGESPTYVVMSPGDYARLNMDFTGVEQVNIHPGDNISRDATLRSSFPNLTISGVPIFADHFCPKGTFYGINCKYTAMYLSEDAAFDFSGFYSLVPLGQIGQQGVVVVGYNVLTAKPTANFVASNLAGAVW